MAQKIIPQMEPWFDEKEAQAAYNYLMSGGWLMEFRKTKELEEMICAFTGSRYCVMTNNGTITLVLALLGLGLKAGDEVLVPNMTMIASANAPKLIGLNPVLVDIDPHNLCMDLGQAQSVITPRTKALMYVAFNGRSAPMAEVVNFCRQHNLFLLEDSAQAFGCFNQGQHLGTFGDVGSFSFSVPKVITTGQGGALVTNNEELHHQLRLLKDFGREQGGADVHNHWGWNFKFTDLQAVIGIEQMKKLPGRLQRKKEMYKLYQERLANVSGITFMATNLSDTAPWFVDIFVEKPAELAVYLKERGIGTRRIYPAIHTQKIYAGEWGHKVFPVSEHYARRGLWLPSASKLSDEEILFVCENIQTFFN